MTELSIQTNCPGCEPGTPVGLFDGAALLGCYPSLADAIKGRALHEQSAVLSIDGIDDDDEMPDDEDKIDLDELGELDERTYRALAAEMDAAYEQLDFFEGA